PVWQRIWDFGNNDNTEDLQGIGTQSIFLTPNNGGGMVLSIFTNGIAGQQVLTAPALPSGGLHQIVWTYDAPSKTGKLYQDGVQVAANTNMTHTLASLGSTMNNWLGHSQYPDADFDGSIAEFRIYDGALSAADVAAHYETGPDPSGRGELLALQLVVRNAMRPGAVQQAQVLAEFQNVSGIDVTAEAGLVFESGDSNILSVNAAGLVTAGTGGSTALTARLAGKSATETVQVIPAEPAVMIHRYPFATDASDSIGGAHGQLVGDAMIDRGEVILSGTKPSYVNLPNGLFSSLTNVTIETWANWKGGGAWQRLFDFGNSSAGEDVQGAADQSFFLTPNNGGGTWLSIFPAGIGGQQAIGAAAIGPNSLRHIVFTYDALAAVGILYVDGTPVGTNANMTYTLADLGPTSNNWLGHSQYVQDADFNGSISEFRIYNGTLAPSEVATNHSVGPDPSGRGALLSLALRGQETMLPGLGQQLQVEGDFENVVGVNLTSESGVTFESASPSLFSVSATGFLNAAGAGSGQGDVTVRYLGRSATRSFQLVPPAPPVLRHRYSFTIDASDSAGGASGTLMGDAAIEDGQVILSGNKPSYVNLPNNLFMNLTDVTLEIWLTWQGGPVWQRIWDFGNNNQPEEDAQGDASFSQSIFLTPNNGGGMVFSIFPNGIANQQVVTGPALTAGAEHHIVWTYSAAAKTARLFVDGAQVGINTAMTHTLASLGSTVNNWLGHSQYVWDADFAGSISEFRVYSGTFLDADVEAHRDAGPDVLPPATPAPRVTFRRGSNVLAVSWPVGPSSFSLESSTQLGTGAAWSEVGGGPVTLNGRNEITIPTSDSARYFRLKH
ncbi:MAG TPA: hypothetical protein DCY13_07380, partial [Verrucomicrobiales bacterium]|nr:hypothetical protein [Verrucomicrobiales bacterium]